MTPLTPTFAVLLALTATSQAQITADIAVSEGTSPLGTITVELDHLNAPVATANFIGLATGKFAWIDSTTGVVRKNTPYYNGIIFHRVIAGFMNQTGSQKGDGSDGPGYTFLDGAEVNNGLNHDAAFVVSMANSGPNSNGSQIFLTAAPASHLNGKHIVFGSISPGASQTLVTTINNVPVIDADGADNIPGTIDDNNRPITDITIDSITVDYNGIPFDPCAQGLPVVFSTSPNAIPSSGDTSVSFHQPPLSTARINYTNDLSTWNFGVNRYLDSNDSPLTTYPLPTEATNQGSAFFNGAIVTYDSSALWPSSLASRTFSALTGADPVNDFTFSFDATGVTGTWVYSNPNNPLSGNIADSFHGPDGYGSRLIMILSGINFNRWDFQRIGFDSDTPTLLNCRQTGKATSTSPLGPFGSLSLDGTSTLTR